MQSVSLASSKANRCEERLQSIAGLEERPRAKSLELEPTRILGLPTTYDLSEA